MGSGIPEPGSAARERTRAHAQAETRAEADVVIRPAAVIPEAKAREVIRWLEGNRLENGGLWNVGEVTGIWQRFDRPWNGIGGTRGEAQLVGTVYVTYDRPRRYEVVIHRVQVTDLGLIAGWTTTKLVDEILSTVGLSIATCERDTSAPSAYKKDPFQRNDAYDRGASGS
jgi:hypothetical protein